MKEPIVEVLSLDDAMEPDPTNINRHTRKGARVVGNSIKRRGAFRSTASAGKGVKKPVVMAGNLTRQQAREAGIQQVINVHTDGTMLVNVVRDDLEPDSPQARALAIEDNEAGKLSYNPDIDVLAAMAAADGPLMRSLYSDEDAIALGMISDMMVGEISLKDAFGKFGSGDKAPFQQIAFIVHTTQADVVQRAIKAAKDALPEGLDSPNQNENGNALWWLCSEFLRLISEGRGNATP